MDTKAKDKESRNFFAGIASTVNGIFTVLNWVLILFITTMCVVMLIQIIFRYLFNMPLTWPEEVARYLFIWVVFLGAAVAFKSKAHLGMDFAVAKLPQKVRKITNHAVEVLILGFFLLILYIAPEVIDVTRFQRSSVIHIQMCWIYLAFPVASLLMILDILTRWICPEYAQPTQD